MKLFKLLMLLFAASVLAVSCDDDDDNNGDPTDPTDPTAVTITESTATYGFEGATYTVKRYTYKDNGGGIGTRTLAASESGTRVEHVMDGFVFVNDGQELTIEAGAVVKGEPGQGAAASALLVARGAVINVEGTSANPVIFTYKGDDVDNNLETADFIPGQWSGLIVLGAAPVNVPGSPVVEGLPTEETRGQYGGSDAADNSGSITWASIRNTGTILASNSELQGLTVGGVGNSTTIDYVESIFSNDDGIEVFGGSVNIEHFLVAFVEDDMFDLDQGWQGNGQWWFGYQYDNDGNRGGEWDGDDAPTLLNTDGSPWSTAKMANLTFIGNRSGDDGGEVLRMRNNAGYSLYNSILASGNIGLRLQANSIEGTEETVPTWYDHFVAGRAEIRSNVIADIGDPELLAVAPRLSGDIFDGVSIKLDSPADEVRLLDSLYNWNNVVFSSISLSYNVENRLDADAPNVDPVPDTVGFPVAADLPSGLTDTDYIGAFDPDVAFSSSWASWTFFYNVYGQNPAE